MSVEQIAVYRTLTILEQNARLLIVNIVVGVWLFITVNKAGGSRWIWALFGLTFGLLAVILFYCARRDMDNDTMGNATTEKTGHH